MYNIKNHKLDAKMYFGKTWATNGYLFCPSWLVDVQKLYEYKSGIDNHIANVNVDDGIQNIIDNNKFYDILPPLFKGQVDDVTKIIYLWRIDYENDFIYFNSEWVGWILYRLNKLKIKDVKYQYSPGMKMLLILVFDEIVAGIMSLNISEKEVDITKQGGK